MYCRVLDLFEPLKKKSHFLLGPRATGKSWLIRHQLKDAQVFDLLNGETYDRLLRRPHSLAEEARGDVIVIDEIQKLPRLLDEVHRLIEEKGIRFLLTGSSARKLKRGGANLLAGRARSLQMFPLTSAEIDGFDLLKYCNYGGLPAIYDSDEPWLDLKEYVHLYLKEEIIAEAAVRKVDHYARFLDVAGAFSGTELNYQRIASESGVPTRTVANFVEVLKDTLLAFELEAERKTRTRKATAKSKLYFFDVGVANYLAGRKEILERSKAFGIALEHFVLQEIRAYLGYRQLDLKMTYWRAASSRFEVDCVVNQALALEIKSSTKFSEKMLEGLRAFQDEKKMNRSILVCRDPIEREIDGIEVMPIEKFLSRLWMDELF